MDAHVPEEVDGVPVGDESYWGVTGQVVGTSHMPAHFDLHQIPTNINNAYFLTSIMDALFNS